MESKSPVSIRDRNLEAYYRNLAVAVWRGDAIYPKVPPFHPHISYPEYGLGLVGDEPNPAYEGVRGCLHLLGLDAEHYGMPDWNPLRGIVVQGDKVVIKPNLVLSQHYEGGSLFAVITHPAVLRAIVDYVYKALDGEGQIVIADAPDMHCDFQELLRETHLASIQDLYWSRYRFNVDILDLRGFWLDSRPGDHAAYAERRIPLSGDPLGSVLINVGKESAFHGVSNWHRFYGADYNRQETIAHHHRDVHEYVISRTVLNADVVISVPKLKVHKKVGVTLNAKGLVGVTTNKNCLVHYTLGTPEEGGDQFPAQTLSFREKLIVKGQRLLYDALLARQNRVMDRLYDGIVRTYRALIKPWLGGVSAEKRLLDGGNWFGNDSTWRMVVDLFKIAVYADKEGILRQAPQRAMFSIVDGIVGGENNGPLTPDEKKAGVVIAGLNPLAVDVVGARLMGFDWQKLKWVQRLVHLDFLLDPNELRIESNVPQFTAMFETQDPLLDFVPHRGWQGHVELARYNKG